MKKLLLAVLALLFATPTVAGPGDILVKFRDKNASLYVSAFGDKVGEIPDIGVEIWHPTTTDALTLLMELERHPAIEWAEPDYPVQLALTPTDPRFTEQYALHNVGQSGGTVDADIDAPEGWETTRGSPNVVVALNDTGLEIDHPDLIDALWVNPGEIDGNGVDDDGNGFIDDIHGWDFTYNKPSVRDTFGHGTHCGGIIAAQHNDIGVCGVAPGVKLMITRGFNGQGAGLTSWLVGGLLYAAKMNAPISSNSWTAVTSAPVINTLRDALQVCADSGMLVVFAAANAGMDIECAKLCPGVTLYHPAHYTNPALFIVASTNRLDNRSSFSNYGLESVDIGAPGESILSTYPTFLTGGGYRVLSGTSMACPLVAGAAALVLSINPTAGSDQLKFVLMNRSDPNAALFGKTVSGGRLNIGNIWNTPTSVEPFVDEPVVTPTAPGDQYDIQGRRTTKDLPNQLNFSRKFKRGKKVVIK